MLCDDCDQPLTSCWSKGRTKQYPYYLCDAPGCPSKRKSIKRAEIEDGAEALLRQLQPRSSLWRWQRTCSWNFGSVKAWRRALQKTITKQITDVDGQIETMLERIVSASNQSVVSALETRIEKLEREKIRRTEQASTALPKKEHLKDFVELALAFLANL